ncbi:MAG: ParB/RepB/Spo0J family partition protein [bacterium]
MARKKALGRGLDALIPGGGEGPAGGEEGPPGGGDADQGIVYIKLEKINAGRFQPRSEFDEESLAELAESIKSQGILQPLLVRSRQDKGYELIAGERRLRAARQAGLEQIPAVVREVDDKTALELSLVENIQREDLDPLEEAEAYKKLITEFGYTQEALSERVGKERATVANLLRLLRLPQEIKEDLREGRISSGHARALLSAESETVMRKLRDQIVEKGISVRETEERARGKSDKSSKKSSGKKEKQQDVHLKKMEDALVRALGTKTRIVTKGKGGEIQIQFYSMDELDRIYRMLAG